MKNKHFNIKIKTSIVAVFSTIVLFIIGVMIYFQYKSSNEFAMITTQKIFIRVSDKVINKIESYDTKSRDFINLAQSIKNIDTLPTISQQHILLPTITKYIQNANYVYGIYLGYKNNDFYIVYNLNLSQKMRDAQKAPKNARWLVKKNLLDKNGKRFSYKTFLTKDFKTISTLKVATNYLPTKRPWYKDASTSNSIIKTKPYIFSSVKEPGVTYAQKIDGKNGAVLSLDITLSSLSKLLNSVKLVDGSASFIFKNDGTIIGQSDKISNKQIKNLNKQYPNSFIKDGKVLDLEKQVIVTINGIKYFKYTTMLKSNFKS